MSRVADLIAQVAASDPTVTVVDFTKNPLFSSKHTADLCAALAGNTVVTGRSAAVIHAPVSHGL